MSRPTARLTVPVVTIDRLDSSSPDRQGVGPTARSPRALTRQRAPPSPDPVPPMCSVHAAAQVVSCKVHIKASDAGDAPPEAAPSSDGAAEPGGSSAGGQPPDKPEEAEAGGAKMEEASGELDGKLPTEPEAKGDPEPSAGVMPTTVWMYDEGRWLYRRSVPVCLAGHSSRHSCPCGLLSG
jgi:hypothetical protein